MPKCLECNKIVSPVHAVKNPTHTIVSLSPDPETRRQVERSIDNHRRYGFLPERFRNSEQARRAVRRRVKYGASEPIFRDKIEEDYLVENTTGGDIGSRVRKSSAPSSNSQDLFWWIAVPAAVIIGVGIVILSNKSDADSTNEDDPHNVPFFPADMLESEIDALHPDSFGMEYRQEDKG